MLPAGWDIQPGIYAVVCATAMLGATFRSAISLVVIVVEGTRGIGERTVCAVLVLVVEEGTRGSNRRAVCGGGRRCRLADGVALF